MTTLAVDHLTFSYDGFLDVLQDVSLRVDPGTVVGLIGPNGSGKSTLLKGVADLVAVRDGTVRVCGADHATPAAKTGLVLLSSNEYLPEFLTGREYLEVLARLYGVRLDDGEVRRWFERFAMRGRCDDLIEYYSHGMRKKTQVISALLLRRPLTVVDETLNGIDVEALHRCERELRRLRDEGLSVLLCTHDFGLLERLADRVLFLDHGVVVEDGPTAELLARHGSLATMVFDRLGEDDD